MLDNPSPATGTAEGAAAANVSDLGTEEEILLAQIWKDVLGRPQIGRGDRYLDLGGNSVALYLILEQIQQKFGQNVDPQLFFDPDHSTLQHIAAVLAANARQAGLQA